MKCQINTNELEKALKRLEVVIPKNTKLEIIKNIKIEAYNEQVILTSTNAKDQLQIYIKDVMITEPGSILLNNTKNILKSFKYFKESYTEIIADNNNVTILNNNKTLQFKIQNDVEEYPNNINFTPKHSYNYNTKDLYNRIKKVQYATSKDMDRPQLIGIHFNKSDIIAIDGYRLALNTDEKLNIDNSFTIAPNTYKALLKLLDKKEEKELKIEHNNEYIKFIFDNMILISRLLQGDYVQYNEILPKSEKINIKLNRQELLKNNEFLYLYSKEIKNYTTKWEIDNNLNISITTDDGIYNVNIKLERPVNEQFIIGLNNKFVIDALKAIDQDEVCIKFTDTLKPVLIETENEKHLIMPIRLEKSY